MIDYMLVHRTQPRNDTKIFRLEPFTISKKNLITSRRRTAKRLGAPTIEFYVPILGGAYGEYVTSFDQATHLARVGFEYGDLEPGASVFSFPMALNLQTWLQYGLCVRNKKLFVVSQGLADYLVERSTYPSLIQPDYRLTVLSKFSALDTLKGI